MKKSFCVSVLCVLLAVVSVSCNKLPQDSTNDVEITVGYAFPSENGNQMFSTKATNPEIFEQFYTELLSGTMMAPAYELTLVGVDNDLEYHLSGVWSQSTKHRVKSGTYKVTGGSTADGLNIQNKCSISFDTTVTIGPNTSTVLLSALYDCFLIIFDDAAITSVVNNDGNGVNTEYFTFDQYFYAFVNTTAYNPAYKETACISGEYGDGYSFTIKARDYNKGEYYVYSDIYRYDSSRAGFIYDLSQMQEGVVYDSESIAAVDLGLSVRWAVCNVGAVEPTDFGFYFAWAETEQKNSYDYTTYKFLDSYSYDYTKYNNEDNLTVLELIDDAASVNWGDGWRTPSIDEWIELAEECTWTWTIMNGVGGYMVSGNKVGYTDRSIFIPATGFMSGSHFYEQSTIYDGDFYGTYLTSTYESEMAFTENYSRIQCGWTRTDGHTVRPVWIY